MVAFVPGFVSQQIANHATQRGIVQQEAQRRFPKDSAAVVRALSDWDKVHPRPKATVKDVADHIEHIRRVAGIDHVGLGSDFDGTNNDLPEGLEDVSKFPVLLVELSRRGWSEADLRKVAGENVLRALARAEQVAQRVQKQRPPSTKTIQEMDGKAKM
jgi:membrane dipeptidase